MIVIVIQWLTPNSWLAIIHARSMQVESKRVHTPPIAGFDSRGRNQIMLRGAAP